MNLYQLHTNPESLDGYVKSQDVNPDFFWQKYGDNPEELKKREKYIARDPEYALKYAEKILKGPFPAGEAAIATDDECALEYVNDVIKKDFYLDGKLIAKY